MTYDWQLFITPRYAKLINPYSSQILQKNFQIIFFSDVYHSIVSIVSLPSSKMVSEVICSYITHKVVHRDFNQIGYDFRAQSTILRVNEPLFDPGDPRWV